MYQSRIRLEAGALSTVGRVRGLHLLTVSLPSVLSQVCGRFDLVDPIALYSAAMVFACLMLAVMIPSRKSGALVLTDQGFLVVQWQDASSCCV